MSLRCAGKCAWVAFGSFERCMGGMGDVNDFRN